MNKSVQIALAWFALAFLPTLAAGWQAQRKSLLLIDPEKTKEIHAALKAH